MFNWLIKAINKRRLKRVAQQRKDMAERALYAMLDLTPMDACSVFAEYCKVEAEEIQPIIDVNNADVVETYTAVKKGLNIAQENIMHFQEQFNTLQQRLDKQMIELGLGNLNPYVYFCADQASELEYLELYKRAEEVV